MKKSEIRFAIALDEQRVPEAISWTATDQGDQTNFAKALNISLWDRDDSGMMRIDLWTKDMPVHEMRRYCLEMIAATSQTLYNAVGDEQGAQMIRTFANELREHFDEEQRKQAEG